MWVGRRLSIFASIGSIAAGEVARARMAGPNAKEQDGGRLAGVVSRLPIPSAIGVGGPKAFSIAVRNIGASTR